MGYEGPSIYLGAAVGSALQRRFSRLLLPRRRQGPARGRRRRRRGRHLQGARHRAGLRPRGPLPGGLRPAHAAPRRDRGRRQLRRVRRHRRHRAAVRGRPAPRRSTCATWAAPPCSGVLCGIGARLFTTALLGRQTPRRRPASRRAGRRRRDRSWSAWPPIAKVAFGDPLTLGAGYDNLTWAFDPRRAVALVLLLVLLRALATIATVAGGGVGGLFIPLVIEGALLGRAVGRLFRTAASGSQLLPSRRRVRLPRRRLPGPAGRGRVRGRGHRPARLHRSRLIAARSSPNCSWATPRPPPTSSRRATSGPIPREIRRAGAGVGRGGGHRIALGQDRHPGRLPRRGCDPDEVEPAVAFLTGEPGRAGSAWGGRR